MILKKAWSIFIISLIMAGLAGCGAGGAGSISTTQSSMGGNTTEGSALVSISLTPPSLTLAKQTSGQFIATGTYANNTTSDVTESVTWSSSDETMATVDKPGHVNGKGSGKVIIKASSGDIAGETTVTITEATLVSITLTPADPSIAKGTTRQFTAMGTFSDTTTQDLTATAQWSSSNTAAATVNTAGLATSVAAGTTTISATSGSISGSTSLTVTPATLESIAITPTNPSIAKGTGKQFAATGIFSDATTQDLTASVTWSSSSTDVATINNAANVKGLAASVAAGSTTITATFGSISGSTSLTVTAATLVSIAITPADPGIAKGTAKQFTATGTYSDNSTQNLTNMAIWTSSATGVATISNAAGSQGLATSIAAGSTTITATSAGISASTSLTVTAATLVSLAITPVNSSMAKGTNKQFTATGTYSDTTTQNLTATVTWTSSTTGVATISNAAGSQGSATSVAAGSTTIMATSGSISSSTTLTVTSATLVSIAITPANPSIVKGTGKQFTATGTYSDTTTQNLTGTVTWTSSTTGVATISNAAGSQGLATSVAAGSTTITATSGSISGSTTLSVTAAVLVSLTVTPASQSISVGATQQFTATGTYSDSSTQILTTTVTWNSSTTGIAAISNASGSNGLATAGAAGTTTITATSGNISATATLSVTAVTNTITLTWDAPLTRDDGSTLNPLTDLTGYKVHYGTASQSYTQTVSVVNPGTMTVTTTLSLAPGTYYIVVTAIDALGQESLYSLEITRTI